MRSATLDHSHFETLRSNMPAVVFAMMLKSLADDCPTQIDQVCTCTAAGDLVGAKQATRQLRDFAENFGGVRGAALIKALEVACDLGQEAMARALADDLKSHVRTIWREIMAKLAGDPSPVAS